MTITAPQNDVPLPAGATHVDSWDYDGPEDEIRTRFFYGTRRGDTGAHRVDLVGTQARDGTVEERLIAVGLGRDSIFFASPHAAPEAAADMLAAAEDWEPALVADKQPRAAMACPLCDGRGDIETDDTAHCAHVE